MHRADGAATRAARDRRSWSCALVRAELAMAFPPRLCAPMRFVGFLRSRASVKRAARQPFASWPSAPSTTQGKHTATGGSHNPPLQLLEPVAVERLGSMKQAWGRPSLGNIGALVAVRPKGLSSAASDCKLTTSAPPAVAPVACGQAFRSGLGPSIPGNV